MAIRARKPTRLAGIIYPARLPRIIMLGALILLAAVSRVNPQSDQPGEYQLEAQFLVNFTKFVNWPDASFADPASHFMVCVIGRDPFGHALDSSLLRQTIENRAVEIVRYPTPASLPPNRGCQIAFISASEKQHFQEIIDFFEGHSTLLVADADGFAELGGTVEFLPEENHVRFAINPESADRADLKVSSNLLALAQIVHDDPSKGKN